MLNFVLAIAADWPATPLHELIEVDLARRTRIHRLRRSLQLRRRQFLSECVLDEPRHFRDENVARVVVIDFGKYSTQEISLLLPRLVRFILQPRTLLFRRVAGVYFLYSLAVLAGSEIPCLELCENRV